MLAIQVFITLALMAGSLFGGLRWGASIATATAERACAEEMASLRAPARAPMDMATVMADAIRAGNQARLSPKVQSAIAEAQR